MMSICWVAICFSFFMMVFFVKYLPADIYLVTIISGFAAFGYLLQDPISRRFDQRRTQLISYTTVSLILVVVIIFEAIGVNSLLFALLILVLRLFLCLSFGTVFVIHFEYFDSRFIATSFAICNVVSRIAAVGAPMVAEIENRQIPLLILLALNISAVAATWFLRKK